MTKADELNLATSNDATTRDGGPRELTDPETLRALIIVRGYLAELTIMAVIVAFSAVILLLPAAAESNFDMRPEVGGEAVATGSTEGPGHTPSTTPVIER